MNSHVSHVSFLCIFVFLLSGSALWAYGDKHPEKKKIQKHHWAAPPEESKRTNPVFLSDDSVLRGQTLYLENCTGCHGRNADGRGTDGKDMTPRPSNLRAMAGHHSDGDMAWKIKKGKGPMPGWEDILSEEEIWDLVNFIQTLKENN